jgi:hypothetical protein
MEKNNEYKNQEAYDYLSSSSDNNNQEDVSDDTTIIAKNSFSNDASDIDNNNKTAIINAETNSNNKKNNKYKNQEADDDSSSSSDTNNQEDVSDGTTIIAKNSNNSILDKSNKNKTANNSSLRSKNKRRKLKINKQNVTDINIDKLSINKSTIFTAKTNINNSDGKDTENIISKNDSNAIIIKNDSDGEDTLSDATVNSKDSNNNSLYHAYSRPEYATENLYTSFCHAPSRKTMYDIKIFCDREFNFQPRNMIITLIRGAYFEINYYYLLKMFYERGVMIINFPLSINNSYEFINEYNNLLQNVLQIEGKALTKDARLDLKRGSNSYLIRGSDSNFKFLPIQILTSNFFAIINDFVMFLFYDFHIYHNVPIICCDEGTRINAFRIELVSKGKIDEDGDIELWTIDCFDKNIDCVDEYGTSNYDCVDGRLYVNLSQHTIYINYISVHLKKLKILKLEPMGFFFSCVSTGFFVRFFCFYDNQIILIFRLKDFIFKKQTNKKEDEQLELGVKYEELKKNYNILMKEKFGNLYEDI